jgi:hypothetical protein
MHIKSVLDHSGDLDIDGRIILKQNLKNLYVMMWTEFIWLRK